MLFLVSPLAPDSLKVYQVDFPDVQKDALPLQLDRIFWTAKADLKGVTRKFVGNVKVRFANNHNIQLTLNDDVIEHIAEATRQNPEALLLDGRGLAHHLERILVLPLGDFIFDAEPGGRTIRASMGADGVRFAVLPNQRCVSGNFW